MMMMMKIWLFCLRTKSIFKERTQFRGSSVPAPMETVCLIVGFILTLHASYVVMIYRKCKRRQRKK